MTTPIKSTIVVEGYSRTGSTRGGPDESIDGSPDAGRVARSGPCLDFLRVQHSDCAKCNLRHLTLFQNVRHIDMPNLTSGIRNGVLRRGVTVYSAGQPGQSVFTVRVGLVKPEAERGG